MAALEQPLTTKVATLASVRLESDRLIPLENLNGLEDELRCLGLANRAQEEIWVVALDGLNAIRTVTCVAVGTYHDCYVSLPSVFSPVLLAAADRFVLAHNHPNGKVDPTKEDIELTARIEAAARTLDIEFDDHIILSPTDWCSMRTKGHLS